MHKQFPQTGKYPFPECEQLEKYYQEHIKPLHLRQLLADKQRNSVLRAEFEDILFDYSHEKVTVETMQKLQEIVSKEKIFDQIESMFKGECINTTENRAVLHVALRAQANDKFNFQNQDVVADVKTVLNDIKHFTDQVRNGSFIGYSGKKLTHYVTIGIGGSYLGIECVYRALENDPIAQTLSNGRISKFLANVDPVDFSNVIKHINHETCLIVINSKTFTTAETILNAKTVKNWLIQKYIEQGFEITTEAQMNEIVSKHMCAASTNLTETSKFGLDSKNVFPFWDFVGGRYSLWSAVGMLPMSLHFGFDYIENLLKGANSIDKHFRTEKSLLKNIPLLLGVLGFYNTTIEKIQGRAILPYSEALASFPKHIQQVTMESNGKRVTNEKTNAKELQYETCVVNFGEPGTNGQHSFYQLIHQGRVLNSEFIGFCQSQTPMKIEGSIPNHEELMSNFFSQPDALALGTTVEELKKQNVPNDLIIHKYFPGDRPSCSFLFKKLDPYTLGQLIAIYEHRTVVEGWLWKINCFDQFGVELGKVLAKNIRNFFEIHANKTEADFTKDQAFASLNSSTQYMLQKFLKNK